MAKSAKKQAPVSRRAIKVPSFPWPKPLRAVGGYFKGAWVELRQVRWPNRSSTWSLTVAVILFSLFFAGIIVALDFVFNYITKEVIL